VVIIADPFSTDKLFCAGKRTGSLYCDRVRDGYEGEAILSYYPGDNYISIDESTHEIDIPGLFHTKKNGISVVLVNEYQFISFKRWVQNISTQLTLRKINLKGGHRG
jgi:hypothetical protein